MSNAYFKSLNAEDNLRYFEKFTYTGLARLPGAFDENNCHLFLKNNISAEGHRGRIFTTIYSSLLAHIHVSDLRPTRRSTTTWTEGIGNGRLYPQASKKRAELRHRGAESGFVSSRRSNESVYNAFFSATRVSVMHYFNALTCLLW